MSNVTTSTATTATANPVVSVTPTAKLLSAVYGYLDLSVKAGRKFDSMIEQALADQKEHSYNRDQCRTVLQSAYRSSFEKLGKADKLEGDALKAYIETGMKKEGPNISKVLTLAFPKDDGASVELAKAEAAGLGINAKLEIARGNTTVAAIQQERANKAAGATPEKGRPTDGTKAATPTPQSPTPLTAAQEKLTPKEQVETNLIALVKFAQSLGLEREEALEFIADWCAEQATESEDDADEPSK